MECKTETAVIETFENCEAETECPLDSEFLLPDYCPDMAAVLKCTITPAILSRHQNGDKLMVDGQATIHVLYLDEERKRLHTFEGVQPFACSVAGGDDAMPRISTRVNYVNCRAVSPRRLDVHGALTVVCQGVKSHQQKLLTAAVGNGVYTRTETMCCGKPFGSAEKILTISEVVDLGVGKPAAEAIVRTCVQPAVTSVKSTMGKIIVKGQVRLTTVYVVAGANHATCQTQHEFPFSQILELDGVSEDMQLAADAERLGVDVGLIGDQIGQNTKLTVAIKLCTRVEAFCNQKHEVLTDAYMSKYPAACTTVPMVARESIGVRQETSTLKEVLSLPSDTITDILDLWCEILSVTQRCDQGCVYADGRLQICMAARDREGVITYYEHVSDFTLQFEDACDETDMTVDLGGVDYAVIGDKLEIRLEMLTRLHGYKTTACRVLERFEPSAEPYAAEKAALRICRACKGTSLWELAKSCHTAVEAIMEENNLTEDCLEQDSLLMVPLV